MAIEGDNTLSGILPTSLRNVHTRHLWIPDLCFSTFNFLAAACQIPRALPSEKSSPKAIPHFCHLPFEF
jgi:hypothetical protein